MNCNGYVYKVGNVVFYDARRWDFGEYYHLDSFDPVLELGESFRTNSVNYGHYKVQSKSKKLRRNSARAFVEVWAKDPIIARNQAQIYLNEALDVIVYPAAHRNRSGGFRPQHPLRFGLTIVHRNFSA